MTTVIWDGEQLIADSKETTICKETRKKTYGYDAVKIKKINGKSTYNGQGIEAVAFCGESRLARAFGLAWVIKYEVTDKDFFSEAIAHKYSGAVLMVLADKIVYIQVNEGVFTFKELSRNQTFAMGSGSAMAKQYAHAVPAEYLMGIAMKADHWTGGTMTVWKDGVLTTGVEAPESFLMTRTLWAIFKNAVK